MLDSQFCCSYLESRGVPEKSAGNTEKKAREIISLSFPVPFHHFRCRHFRWCNFLSLRRWNFRWRHCSPANVAWTVPIYYWRVYQYYIL